MEPSSDLTQALQKGYKFLGYFFPVAISLVGLIIFVLIVLAIIHYVKVRKGIKHVPKTIHKAASEGLAAIKKLKAQANTIITSISHRQGALDPATAAKLKGILNQGQLIVKEMQRRLASLQQRVADKESNLPDTLVNRFSDSTDFVAQTYLEIKIAIESLPVGGKEK